MLSNSPRTVLIVDDDKDICANIKDIFDDQGYHTDTAHDGVEAIRMLHAQVYDLAILDFKMPGMDGATLQRAIKILCPQMISIMITAYSGSDGARQAKEAGILKVLRKPVDAAELLPLVVQALG